MSTAMRRFLRPLLLALILLGACLQAHADLLQLDIKGVPQQGSNLCWAAVSQMAINHFGSTKQAVTQGQLAAYNRRRLRTVAEIIAESQDPQFQADVLACTNIPTADCDRRGDPLLLGLKYASTETGPLTKKQLVRQIKRKKPVLLEWSFDEGTDASLPKLGHYLIVVGAEEDGGRLIVWDPWPFQADGLLPDSEHEKSLSYEQYRDPGVLMGQGVSHVSEIFNLRMDGSAPVDLDADVIPTNLPTPPPINRRPLAPPPMRTVPFEDALRATAPFAVSAEALKPRAPIRGRPAETDIRVAGMPLPIVVITPKDLLQPRIDFERLLRPFTSTVLYPVLVKEKVVDAYLATIGPAGWAERGYASTEVTRRLVQQAAGLDSVARELYVVAVPAWGTFFLARGFGPNALLTPIAKTTFSEVGEPMRAGLLLERMAADMRARTSD